MENEISQIARNCDIDENSHCEASYDKHNENEDLYSDDSDSRDGPSGDRDDEPPRKRRKKAAADRKVPPSEEDAEKKRILANSQERERMNRLNRALSTLRKVLPSEFSISNRRLSKIRTLRVAVSYIRGLSAMLAEDKARVEMCPPPPPPPPPFQYPCPYPPDVGAYPGVVFRPGEVVAPVNFLGGGGGGGGGGDRSADEGYFSSFNESFHQDGSFMGTATPTTPFYFPHPSLHPVSPDDGYPGSFVTASPSPLTTTTPTTTTTPMFSPDRCSWLSSTPLAGHPPGHFAPAPFTDSVEDLPRTAAPSFLEGACVRGSVDDSGTGPSFLGESYLRGHVDDSRTGPSFHEGSCLRGNVDDSRTGLSYLEGPCLRLNVDDSRTGTSFQEGSCLRGNVDDSRTGPSFQEGSCLRGAGLTTPDHHHSRGMSIQVQQAGFLSLHPHPPRPPPFSMVTTPVQQRSSQSHHHSAVWSSPCPPELAPL